MAVAVPAIYAGLKIGKAIFGHKGENERKKEERRAAIAQLTLRQQMGEDERLSKAGLGASLLNGLAGRAATGGGDAYGGRVNLSNLKLDPAVQAEIMKRRTYDFSQAVPDTTKGSGWNLAGGLFGAGADALAMMKGGGGAPANIPNVDYSDPSKMLGGDWANPQDPYGGGVPGYGG